MFDRAVSGREVALDLADLQQGNHLVTDYSIDFHTLAVDSKWNKEARWDTFLHGLTDRIQREKFALDLFTNLDDLIELTMCVDNHLQRCDQPTCQLPFPEVNSSNVTVSLALDPEPMQVGRTPADQGGEGSS